MTNLLQEIRKISDDKIAEVTKPDLNNREVFLIRHVKQLQEVIKTVRGSLPEEFRVYINETLENSKVITSIAEGNDL